MTAKAAGSLARLALAGSLLCHAASGAWALDVSEEARSQVEREIFTGTLGSAETVFKQSARPLEVTIAGARSLTDGETLKAQSAVNRVAAAYHQVLPAGTLVSKPAREGATANLVIFLVNGGCDIACRDAITARGPGGWSLLLENKDEGSWPVCVAKAPVDRETGRIGGGVGVVDVMVPEGDLTWCLLQAINMMLSRTNNLQDIAFMQSYKQRLNGPDEIVRGFFALPGKALGLRLLYDPSIAAGMSREAFWSTVGKLPHSTR